MEEKKREEIIQLYDIYNNLLTDKQKLYFEDYCYIHIPFCKRKCRYCSFVSFNKPEMITGYIYSLLKEISENYEISINAVHDQLKRTIDSLYEYENNLKLKEKMSKIENLDINEDIKKLVLDILWEE